MLEPRRDPPSPGLGEEYAAALRSFLIEDGEEHLQRAYALGRRAIDVGLGILEVLSLHEEALAAILEEREGAAAARVASGAPGRFLAESLSPFEMTHRGFHEAVAGLQRLNDLLEDEARRIAHALHDDAGQLLASVYMALEEVSTGLPAAPRERLSRVRDLLDEMQGSLRRLSHELRPTILDDLGLVPALEFLAQGVASRSGLTIDIDGPRRPRLPPAVETALYRVVQEAVRNTVRHAGASRVDVQVGFESGVLCCTVVDDGGGFDVAGTLSAKGGRGLGLIGMRERLKAVGGTLRILSEPSRGTELHINIPLEECDAHSSSSCR